MIREFAIDAVPCRGVLGTMNDFSRIFHTGIAPLLLMCLVPGCNISPDKSPTKDCAYTYYWPTGDDTHKVRLAVKDLIDMKGVVTTAGSEYLAKHGTPATKDADCLKLARQRKDVQIVGKTNLSEFALRASGMNDYYGTPVNPLDRGRIPGGSSSGSAVAVANGTADVAFGTDTCGSIRVPAACCGVCGLKTTFGMISTKGIFPISPTHMDTVGPMAKDVAHLVTGMDLLQAGFESKYRAAVSSHPDPKKIKVFRLYLNGTDKKIDKAIDDALAAAGFNVVAVAKEFATNWAKAEKDGQTLAQVDAYRNDHQYMDKADVQGATKTVIFSGKIASESKYCDALLDQDAFKARLKEIFTQVDFIVLPALQQAPLHKPLIGGNIVFELRALSLQNTEPMNLVGNPALVVPVPVKGLDVPVTGMQIVGPYYSEAKLLNAGRLIEEKFPPQPVAKRTATWRMFHRPKSQS